MVDASDSRGTRRPAAHRAGSPTAGSTSPIAAKPIPLIPMARFAAAAPGVFVGSRGGSGIAHAVHLVHSASLTVMAGRRSAGIVAGVGEGDELAQAVVAQRGGEVGGEAVEHDPPVFAGDDEPGAAQQPQSVDTGVASGRPLADRPRLAPPLRARA